MTLYITKQGTSPLAITEIARGTGPGLNQAVYKGQDQQVSRAQNPTGNTVIETNNNYDPDGIDVV
jgi:hypothetical protein